MLFCPIHCKYLIPHFYIYFIYVTLHLYYAFDLERKLCAWFSICLVAFVGYGLSSEYILA